MRTLSAGVVGRCFVVVLFSSVAGSMAAGAPEVPEALRPPADQALALEARAEGVQIYECSAGQDPARFEWVFKSPEAELSDISGRKIGKHYAGPTWESVDGSKVVGGAKASDPGPDASAIPWLLLGAKSNSGSGVFGRVKSIQRLQTVGGKAPTTPCGQANVKEVARVPYKATYYFYAPKP